MRYYETLYIVNPNYEQERLTDVIETVAEEVKKSSVNIIEQIVWGKKRLAYRIQNHKYGTYILLKLETENPGFLNDFNMFMKLNKAVIRAQTIRLDEKPEAEEEIKSVDINRGADFETAPAKKAKEEQKTIDEAVIEDSSAPKDEEKENKQEKPAEESIEEMPVNETETTIKAVDEDPENGKTEIVESEKENPEPVPEPEEDRSTDQDDNDTTKGNEEKEEK